MKAEGAQPSWSCEFSWSSSAKIVIPSLRLSSEGSKESAVAPSREKGRFFRSLGMTSV